MDGAPVWDEIAERQLTILAASLWAMTTNETSGGLPDTVMARSFLDN
jgi:hypothetical protein